MRPAVLLGAGAATATAIVPVSLAITGAASVLEGGTAQYTGTVAWSDETTTDETLTATWSDNSEYATINSSGLLTALPVSDDQSVTVSASYTSGGVTVSDTHSVTVLESNHYHDANIRDDAVTWPLNARMFDKPAWLVAPWLDASGKSELLSEWKVTNEAATWLAMTNASAAGYGGGFYVGAGTYVPSFNETGAVTNDADFSTAFDAMRALIWVYWTSADASDQVYFDLGQRSTKGATNWGGVSVRCDRNSSSVWGIVAWDGAGNTVTENTALNGNGVFAALQCELVKGSHFTFKVVSAGSRAGYQAPSWPIAESGYWDTISLAGAGFNLIGPTSPGMSCASSADQEVARLYRYAFEFRRIGHTWEYLVDS